MGGLNPDAVLILVASCYRPIMYPMKEMHEKALLFHVLRNCYDDRLH
jgi:hypothetical protein